MNGPMDLRQSGPCIDLGWYLIAGHWDGRHCPTCGSETWLPLDAGQARCLACRAEWQSLEDQ